LKAWGARAIAYSAVALFAYGALRGIHPLPDQRPGAVLPGKAHRPGWHERIDTLGSGETLSAVLSRGGLNGKQALSALAAAISLDARRVPAGMRVTLGGFETDSLPSLVVLHLAVDRLLRLSRTDTGWVGKEQILPWTTDTIVVRGAISSTLYDAMETAASELPQSARIELAWDVADIFEYRVDMSRDLQVGDAFAVLVERKRGPEGAVRPGRIFAASLANGGTTIRAIRQEMEGSRARYFDQDGKSMEAAFLRAPLQFRRISSVFGMRKHPILGIWRAHKGTDYSAASGTPVRAVGDAVVSFEGRKGGYGNVMELRHANGMVSRYGHLRGFAKGMHKGSRVSMGQTIAYVGATGLATAPHLHFETLVGGVQRNPHSVLTAKSGEPLAPSYRASFDASKERYLAMLAGPALSSVGNNSPGR
jgi:murein DD-endopeptidase MepM/ murein hydrolase activator NlpD